MQRFQLSSGPYLGEIEHRFPLTLSIVLSLILAETLYIVSKLGN